MTVSDPRSWPPEIRERYGVGIRSRWVIPAVLFGVVLLGLVGFLGVRVLATGISAGVTGFSIKAEDHVAITFTIERKERLAATCVVRARAQDGFDVGYAVVPVPAAAGRTEHSYDLRTAYRAITGELLGCALGQDPPLHVPPAQFRPGVIPPDQPWTSSVG